MRGILERACVHGRVLVRSLGGRISDLSNWVGRVYTRLHCFPREYVLEPSDSTLCRIFWLSARFQSPNFHLDSEKNIQYLVNMKVRQTIPQDISCMTQTVGKLFLDDSASSRLHLSTLPLQQNTVENPDKLNLTRLVFDND